MEGEGGGGGGGGGVPRDSVCPRNCFDGRNLCHPRYYAKLNLVAMLAGVYVLYPRKEMKLQPGICPFPVLGLKTQCRTLVPWHVAGISCRLPVSTLLSEEQQNNRL